MRAAVMAVAAGLALAAPARAADPEPPLVASLLAPAVRVADCPKAEAFYRTALGMRTLMSRDLGAIHETMLAFGGDNAGPGIMLICKGSAASPQVRGIGGSRLIIDVADMDRIAARLDGAGLSHPAVHAPQAGIKVLLLRDPDGNELELVQRAPRR